MKTKTINGVKFYNDHMFINKEWKGIFEMTKEELENILPLLRKEVAIARDLGDNRKANCDITTIKRVKLALENFDILSKALNKNI